MSLDEINAICTNADMIVGGYAFTEKDDASVHIVQLDYPHHALVLTTEGEVLETSMDDVELEIELSFKEMIEVILVIICMLLGQVHSLPLNFGAGCFLLNPKRKPLHYPLPDNS